MRIRVDVGRARCRAPKPRVIKPNVGRFTEIPYDQLTPELQEAYRSFIDAEALELDYGIRAPTQACAASALPRCGASGTREPLKKSRTSRLRSFPPEASALRRSQCYC